MCLIFCLGVYLQFIVQAFIDSIEQHIILNFKNNE